MHVGADEVQAEHAQHIRREPDDDRSVDRVHERQGFERMAGDCKAEGERVIAEKQIPDRVMQEAQRHETEALLANQHRHFLARLDRKSTRLNSQSLMRMSYAVVCLKKEICTIEIAKSCHTRTTTILLC